MHLTKSTPCVISAFYVNHANYYNAISNPFMFYSGLGLLYYSLLLYAFWLAVANPFSSQYIRDESIFIHHSKHWESGV